MRDEIPDQPDIASALVTGYPRGHREPPVVCCAACGRSLEGRTDVFLFDGDKFCGDCCSHRISSDFSFREIAEAMGATVKPAYACGEAEGDTDGGE